MRDVAAALPGGIPATVLTHTSLLSLPLLLPCCAQCWTLLSPRSDGGQGESGLAGMSMRLTPHIFCIILEGIISYLQ